MSNCIGRAAVRVLRAALIPVFTVQSEDHEKSTIKFNLKGCGPHATRTHQWLAKSVNLSAQGCNCAIGKCKDI